MEGDYMFGSLHSFLEEDYFQKHKKGELIVGNTTYDLNIFAVMNTEATKDILFSPTECAQKDVIGYIRGHAERCRKEVADQLSDECYRNNKSRYSRFICKYKERISTDTCRYEHKDSIRACDSGNRRSRIPSLEET